MVTTQATTTKPLTGIPAPTLEVQTLEGKVWKLSEQKPENYTIIFFYRGLHCPLCKAQLQDINGKIDDFAKLGVNVIAISGDTQERAKKSQEDWSITNVKIGYGIDPEVMRTWGLYISKGQFSNEPPLFGEPAVFMVRPDGILTYAVIGSHPFGRPPISELISGIDYILKNNYPVRGTEI